MPQKTALITLSKRAFCDKAILEPGEYQVTIRPEDSALILSRDGKEYSFHAAKGLAKKPSQKITVHLFKTTASGLSVLCYAIPPKTEWIAFIQMEP